MDPFDIWFSWYQPSGRLMSRALNHFIFPMISSHIMIGRGPVTFHISLSLKYLTSNQVCRTTNTILFNLTQAKLIFDTFSHSNKVGRVNNCPQPHKGTLKYFWSYALKYFCLFACLFFWVILKVHLFQAVTIAVVTGLASLVLGFLCGFFISRLCGHRSSASVTSSNVSLVKPCPLDK